MKRFFSFALLLTTFAACKKDSQKDGDGSSKTSFINTAPGSVWNYKEVNASDGAPVTSSYSITSTPADTVINGRNYHVYQYSYGGSKYLAKTNNDYHEFAHIINMGQEVERLYLKGNAPVNTSWSEDFTLTISSPVSVTVRLKATNQIVEIGPRSVEGTSYDNVIYVKTTISSPEIPAASLTSDIHSYFAPEYGMVENRSKVEMNYLGFTSKIDVTTTLTSATLK